MDALTYVAVAVQQNVMEIVTLDAAAVEVLVLQIVLQAVTIAVQRVVKEIVKKGAGQAVL